MIRNRIVFCGSVQGVGFRWCARHAANLYSCTGWVHLNLKAMRFLHLMNWIQG